MDNHIKNNNRKTRKTSNRKKSISISDEYDKSKNPNQKLFKKLIDAWINNDKQIENVLEYIKKLRERKIQLEKKLVPYIKHNNLDKSYIIVSNHKICMENESVYQNLSFKYINEKLQNILEQSQIDKICNILREGRSKNVSVVLKRK